MRQSTFSCEFIESIPEKLEDGKLYISIRYRTSSHLCACGCKNKVVTPLKPSKWKLCFDGDSVSLFPSIGNWQFPCKAHYWIDKNQVRWAKPWTNAEILEGRQKDAEVLHRYYLEKSGSSLEEIKPVVRNGGERGVFGRIWRHFGRR